MTHATPTTAPTTVTTTPTTNGPDKPRRPGSPPDPHAFQEPHVPVRTYLLIFAALMGLLVLTVVVAFIPSGNFGIVIALAIAVLKAVLVILYFMHVKYASPLVKVVVISGFVWFFIALGLTFTDYLTRPWLPQSAGWQDNPIRADRYLPDPVPGDRPTRSGH